MAAFQHHTERMVIPFYRNFKTRLSISLGVLVFESLRKPVVHKISHFVKIKALLIVNYKYLQCWKSVVILITNRYLVHHDHQCSPAVCDVLHEGRLQQRHHIFSICMAVGRHGHQFMWLRENDHRVCSA